MGVRVDDVDGAAAQAVTLVTTAGGFVGADRRSSGAVTDEAMLELRVPAARFTALIDQLAALGDQLNRDVKTEDVTEETVDLEARIETQRVRVDSGRKLLAGVTDRTEWLAWRREVAQRESDLASLEAKQRRLADLVALSTITVTFFRAAPPTARGDGPGLHRCADRRLGRSRPERPHPAARRRGSAALAVRHRLCRWPRCC